MKRADWINTAQLPPTRVAWQPPTRGPSGSPASAVTRQPFAPPWGPSTGSDPGCWSPGRLRVWDAHPALKADAPGPSGSVPPPPTHLRSPHQGE